MKKNLHIILILCLVFVSSCIKKREVKVESEKTIVEEIIREFVQGLEKADTEKVLGFYAKSPRTVLIGTGDDLLVGYDAVESFYREFIPILNKWQKREFIVSDLKIRIIDGVAWFYSKLILKYEQFEKQVEKNVRFTGILIKEEGIWKLVQVHTSLPSS